MIAASAGRTHFEEESPAQVHLRRIGRRFGLLRYRLEEAEGLLPQRGVVRSSGHGGQGEALGTRSAVKEMVRCMANPRDNTDH